MRFWALKTSIQVPQTSSKKRVPASAPSTVVTKRHSRPYPSSQASERRSRASQTLFQAPPIGFQAPQTSFQASQTSLEKRVPASARATSKARVAMGGLFPDASIGWTSRSPGTLEVRFAVYSRASQASHAAKPISQGTQASQGSQNRQGSQPARQGGQASQCSHPAMPGLRCLTMSPDSVKSFCLIQGLNTSQNFCNGIETSCPPKRHRRWISTGAL